MYSYDGPVMLDPSVLFAIGTEMVSPSSSAAAPKSHPLPAIEKPRFMMKPVPAWAAFVGLLLAPASLRAATRISPRLLTSRSSLWLPFVKSIGLRMKMSIEYSTLPRAFRGARLRSVITALRGSSGSTSPNALPRSFSYCPTFPSAPKIRPSKAGDSDRARSMTMRVTCASAAGANTVVAATRRNPMPWILEGCACMSALDSKSARPGRRNSSSVGQLDPRHHGHFGCASPTDLLGEQVGIMSAVPHDDVADPDGDRPPKDRAVVDKGMKLPVLAAGIDARRQRGKQVLIVRPPHETRADLPLDAGQIALEAQRDHLEGQLGCVSFPERKNPPHIRLGQVPFPIGAQVFQKQVAESDRLDTSGFVRGHHIAHDLLVRLIGTRVIVSRWEIHLVQRDTDRVRLLFEQHFSDAVVADAPVFVGNGGQERDDVVLLAATHFVQRHRAVFAAAPGHHDWSVHTHLVVEIRADACPPARPHRFR